MYWNWELFVVEYSNLVSFGYLGIRDTILWPYQKKKGRAGRKEGRMKKRRKEEGEEDRLH